MVIKKIHPPKPPKPLDRLQNMQTIRPLGKTKWVKAHWRWNCGTHSGSGCWVTGAHNSIPKPLLREGRKSAAPRNLNV